jgi:transposase
MLIDGLHAEHIYVACGHTDMRKSIDGLAACVKQRFQLDPFSNSLFLFCGHHKDRIKALWWDQNGFVLLYKRLESGKFQWPRDASDARDITPQQFRWLMEGLNINQPKAHRPVKDLSVT